MKEKRERLHELCGKCVAHGKFTLASGKESDFYFDGRLVSLHPEGAHLIGELMFAKAKELGATALSGISVGSDPLVSTTGHVAYLAGSAMKMAYVRKEAKQHGKKKEIEGPALEKSDRVVILEDVVTTGGSSLTAVSAVQRVYGCEIIGIIALMDRKEGAREEIEKAGFKLFSIFTRDDFKE